MKQDGSEVYVWLTPHENLVLLWTGRGDEWILAPVIAVGKAAELGPVLRALSDGGGMTEMVKIEAA
jgi:hypothetical protein